MSENELICAIVMFSSYVMMNELRCPGVNTLFVRMKKLLSSLGLEYIITEAIPGKSRENLVATLDKLATELINNNIDASKIPLLISKLRKYYPRFKQTLM